MFHYYSLVLNKARHADDGYKKNGPREASFVPNMSSDIQGH